ncbi:facilitated trehalose transporter Tret1-like [Condylostylus longicornis]|uniref:facilitated trehalose transporter Tret1-like n=1 Tax=Condylostylus longicornis TaxID=2530218 RepID=UPI00244E36FB|nr:facilitated trehalose transporter Tret1-like [Condylostylus longicornis]
MAKSSAKYQYYATLCANILSMSYGAFCGWPSSSFLVLQSKDSPLDGGPMTDEQASWVGSLLCVGGFVGNYLFGWLANFYGRKISMMLIVIPTLMSLALIILASSVEYLYVSRFLGGLAGGATFCIVPLYITEISEDRIRGQLGSYLVLSANFGLLVAYVLGCYVDYDIFPYILTIFPILFIILFAFLPETPPQLLKVKKIKEAEISLRYFRNLRKISKEPPEYFKSELEKLKHDYLDDPHKSKGDENQLSWKDFTTKPALKAFVIGVALMALNQFCGCFAMINYTATIFVKAGSTLSPNISSIIVALIQLIGSYFSVILVERAGRKLLIAGSAFGTGIGHLCMGTFILLDNMPGYDVSGYRWVPLACFSFIIFIVSWGVSTLPFLLVSELCPPKIREIVLSVCISVLWFFAFFIIKYLSVIVDAMGLHGALFIFSACSFTGGIFVLAFVPETKGKSIDEIIAMLE